MFLRKLKWISYRGSGEGVTPCEFNIWFIMGFAKVFVHFGKTHTFWQKEYSGAKEQTVKRNGVDFAVSFYKLCLLIRFCAIS